jgi:hypothetical protein
VSDAFTSLEQEEKKLFTLLINEKTKKIFNKSYNDFTVSNPSQIIDKENLWPKENPNWMKSPHLQATLAAFAGKAAVSNINII